MENKSPYQRKLAHPEWQKKRLEVYQRDEFTCQYCGSKEKELHVHHKYYDLEYTPPQNYPMESMITLCHECHEIEQGKMERYPIFLIQQLKESGFDSICIIMLYAIFKDIKNDRRKCIDRIKAMEACRLWEVEEPEMIEKINRDVKKLHTEEDAEKIC